MQIHRVKISDKRLANVLLSVNVGWSHEPIGKRGISHFLEHAVFLGNEEHPDPDKEVAKYGAILNGETLADRTIFYFTSLPEDVPEILNILLSLVYNPAFPEEKVWKEKESKIIPAVVKESDYRPWELAYEWARNLIFEWDFRYSMGTKEELKNTGIEGLKDWHRKYYHAENSNLLVPESIEVQDFKIPTGGKRPEVQKVRHKENRKVIERGLENAEIVCAFPLEKYDIRAYLLSVILGNFPTSIFWQAFHRDAYMVESKVEWYNSRGALFLYLGANTKNERKMREKFESFIEKLRISREDVEIAKKILSIEILEKERSVYSMENLLKFDPLLRYGSFAEILEEINNISFREMKEHATGILNSKDMYEVVVR